MFVNFFSNKLFSYTIFFNTLSVPLFLLLLASCGSLKQQHKVAVALRNRWRRRLCEPESLRDEISPKNLLMVGSTGVGKTELARRLAKMVNAPFVKVEATKFTEVGYHGRDVDTIIRDLVANAFTLAKTRLRNALREEIDQEVEAQLLYLLSGAGRGHTDQSVFLAHLRAGELDDTVVEVAVPAAALGNNNGPSASLRDGPGNSSGGTTTFIAIETLVQRQAGSEAKVKKKMPLREAREVLRESELMKRISEDTLKAEALRAAQEDGIVFIDEIDKVCIDHKAPQRSGDASNEGVQRDLLPLVEGTTVETKWGDVDTSKVLFIASGAFHAVKVSDILPELQGRLPVRVHLDGLTEADLYRILTEPVASMLKQQVALLGTEGLSVTFTECAARRIAAVAAQMNHEVENIGARRLHTVLEKVLEELSFDADRLVTEAGGTRDAPIEFTIDAAFVDKNIGAMLQTSDLRRFIL